MPNAGATYTRIDGNITRMVSVRVPYEIFNHILDLQYRWQCPKSQCILKLLQSGLKNKGLINPIKPISDESKKEYQAVLARDYQFLNKQDFIDDYKIPVEIVDAFYQTHGE